MKSINRRSLITMPGIASATGGFQSLASTQDSKWDRTSPREIIRARYFPNVALTTHEGSKVRFYDDLIKDKIVTINFMYADCEGVCPGITANLVKVQRALGERVGRDIFMYSITLKPEHDSPEVLKEYVQMHRVQPGWLFLTGAPQDLEALRRKLGFTNPDPKLDADSSQHIGMLRYGNEPLQQWAACPGLANPGWIVESILWVDWPKARQPKIEGARRPVDEKGERK